MLSFYIQTAKTTNSTLHYLKEYEMQKNAQL